MRAISASEVDTSGLGASKLDVSDDATSEEAEVINGMMNHVRGRAGYENNPELLDGQEGRNCEESSQLQTER